MRSGGGDDIPDLDGPLESPAASKSLAESKVDVHDQYCAPTTGLHPHYFARESNFYKCAYFRCGPCSPQLLFAVLFFCATAYLNSMMQLVAEQRKATTDKPLDDVGHSLFPFLDFPRLNDILIGVFLLMTVIRFGSAKSLRWVVLRRYLLIQGALFFFRSMTVALTSLTLPGLKCTSNVSGHWGIEAILVAIGYHHTCADLLFSGHTATNILLAHIWSFYSRGEEWQLCCGPAVHHMPFLTPTLTATGDVDSVHLTMLLAWMFSFANIFVILATHFHYSVDCVLGVIITTLTFRLYHLAIKAAGERTSLSARFLLWLEGMQIVPGSMDVPVSLTTGPSEEEVEAQQVPILPPAKEHIESESTITSRLIAVPGEVSVSGFIPYHLTQEQQGRSL